MNPWINEYKALKKVKRQYNITNKDLDVMSIERVFLFYLLEQIRLRMPCDYKMGKKEYKC